MAYVNTAHDGIDILDSIITDLLPTIQARLALNYRPLIVWDITGQQKKQPPDRIFLEVVNFIEADDQKNIGRPRRYVVLGSYNVTICYPTFKTLEHGVEHVAEDIKSAYRFQNRLSPYNVRNSLVNRVRPTDRSRNKLNVCTKYRFQYFVS